MSKLTLSYGQQLKELTIAQCESPSQLSKLLKSTFKVRQQILGVTDSCGKFYDLAYASQNIKSLNKHKLNLVTSKDANVDNMSFGSKRSTLNQFVRGDPQTNCLGKIIDLQKFKDFLPFGLVVILTLNQNDQTQPIPFRFYLARSQKRFLEIWSDQKLLIECQIGDNLSYFYEGVKNYLKKLGNSSISTQHADQIIDLSTKQAMIMNSFQQLHQEGILTDIQFYKKKILLLEKPQYFVNKFFTGETIDRSQLVDQILEYIIKRREQARILSIVSQSTKQQIPIFVRKGSNRIEKVSSGHLLSLQQQQVLNLFQQLQLKGLITQKQLDLHHKLLLDENNQLMRLSGEYFEKEFDQIQLARKLRNLIRREKESKKLIQ